MIHEDEAQLGKPQEKGGRTNDIPVAKLSQPARRVVPPLRDTPCLAQVDHSTRTEQETERLKDVKHIRPSKQPRRLPSRASTSLQVVDDETPKRHMGGLEGNVSKVQEPARRNTLYVPSEDTTQPTMWMGIFSPIKHDSSNIQIGMPEYTGIAAQMMEKRRRKAPGPQPKPIRGPLQQNLTAQEKAGLETDRPGAPTGKENLPPGQVKTEPETKQTGLEAGLKDRDLERRKFLCQARLDMLAKTKLKVECSSPNLKTMYEVGKTQQDAEQADPKRIAWNAGPRPIESKEQVVKKSSISKPRSPAATPFAATEEPRIPTRIVQPVLRNGVETCPPLPLLEHIESPEMYEDDWLGHQESAIMQLLHSPPDQTQCSRPVDHCSLRQRLLEKYNGPEIKLLHSRVQAAILYGSLSLPYEQMFQLHSLVKDVRRKQQFLRFWLDTYDNKLLKIALEVVIGKQIEIVELRRSSQSKPIPSGRQVLANSIESFLLRHEEAHFKSAGTGISSNDLGCKTILKSLMLLKALDLLKHDPELMVDECLFRPNAAFKASTLAVQALLQILNSAVGDGPRALRQLGYEVHCEQEPIEEIKYHVENLAVDLQDTPVRTSLENSYDCRRNDSEHARSNNSHPNNERGEAVDEKPQATLH